MLERQVWTPSELEQALAIAIRAFQEQRMQEPLEAYLELFERYQGILENLIETTVDLTLVRSQAAELLCDESMREVLRFITGPPVSEDDLKVLSEAKLSRRQLRADPDMVGRVIDVLLMGLDRRRFPWIGDGREANAQERDAAILATAALIATSRAMTLRRNDGRQLQEAAVELALLETGFEKVPTRRVSTISQAPAAGQFCRESDLVGRKADFIIGLHDNRIMALECKVSNSATNSIKRLNNDAVVKGKQWIHDFGTSHVVPAAMLSGVFKLHHLESAQDSGLALFWAHELPVFTQWLLRTQNTPRNI